MSMFPAYFQASKAAQHVNTYFLVTHSLGALLAVMTLFVPMHGLAVRHPWFVNDALVQRFPIFWNSPDRTLSGRLCVSLSMIALVLHLCVIWSILRRFQSTTPRDATHERSELVEQQCTYGCALLFSLLCWVWLNFAFCIDYEDTIDLVPGLFLVHGTFYLMLAVTVWLYRRMRFHHTHQFIPSSVPPVVVVCAP